MVIIPQAPESIAHHIIGLLYLLGVVIVPSFLLMYKFPFLFLVDKKETVSHEFFSKTKIILPLILFAAFVTSNFFTRNHLFKPMASDALLNSWNEFAYEGNINGVHKFTNTNFLFWVKPLEGFYSAEHSPLGCWRGSGYIFNETGLNQIDGASFSTGTLQSEKELLYTAWWFESDKTITGNAFGWRKEALMNGESFSLVNITTDDPEKLNGMVKKLWDEKAISE